MEVYCGEDKSGTGSVKVIVTRRRVISGYVWVWRIIRAFQDEKKKFTNRVNLEPSHRQTLLLLAMFVSYLLRFTMFFKLVVSCIEDGDLKLGFDSSWPNWGCEVDWFRTCCLPYEAWTILTSWTSFESWICDTNSMVLVNLMGESPQIKTKQASKKATKQTTNHRKFLFSLNWKKFWHLHFP